MATARQRAAVWAASGEHHAPYAAEWLRVLDLPQDQLIAQLVDPSERARDLRQATPFSGAVDPRERWRLWKDVRDQWEAQ